MKTFKMILIAITFIFSMNVLAGYTQPAPVVVVINDDGSFSAGGDMNSARTADNDVESIGCGVRKNAAHNNWGFCQASDENDEYVACWTQDTAMLEAFNLLNDTSYISFGGEPVVDRKDGVVQYHECTYINASSQSIYAPNTTTKGSN